MQGCSPYQGEQAEDEQIGASQEDTISKKTIK